MNDDILFDPTALAHIIEPSDPRGVEFGYTRELFDGYLWDNKDHVYISLIISHDPGKGNTQKLIKRMLDKWGEVRIPIPSPGMIHIGKKMGGKMDKEYDMNTGEDVPVMLIKREG